MFTKRSIASRYRQLGLWSRLGVWGSVASIISLAIFFLWPQTPSDSYSAVVDRSPKATVIQSGRDVNARQIGQQIINLSPEASRTDDFSLMGSVSIEDFVLMQHNGTIDPQHPESVVALCMKVVNTSSHDIFPLGVATTLVGKNPSTGQLVCLTFLPSSTDSMEAIRPGEPRTFRFHLVRPAEIAAMYNAGRASCLTTFQPSRGKPRSILWRTLSSKFATREGATYVAEETLTSTVVDVIVDKSGLLKETQWLDSATAALDFKLLAVHSSLDPETRMTSVVETDRQARQLIDQGLTY